LSSIVQNQQRILSRQTLYIGEGYYLFEVGQKLSKDLPTIKCECGAELKIVPDLEEMACVIEKHAQKHGKIELDQRNARAIFDHIQDSLIMLTLQKVSHLNP
jgi:hypothetical protein